MAEPRQKFGLAAVDLLQLTCNAAPPLHPPPQPLIGPRCGLRRRTCCRPARCWIRAHCCGCIEPSHGAVAVGARQPRLRCNPGAAPRLQRARLWVDAVRDGSDHDCADLTPGCSPSGSDNCHADASKCKEARLVGARRGLQLRGACDVARWGAVAARPSLRGAQRRGNPGFCATADGLLRSSP
jgi:hypothetical protein